MTVDAVGKQLVQILTTQRQEPNWLREMREQALAAYEQLPAPHTLDLRTRPFGPFAPRDPDRACPERWEMMTPFQSERGRKKAEVSRLVYANERKIAHHLDMEVAENGVIFADLSLAVRVFPSLVEPYLGQAVTADDKWTALSTAVWNLGVFVYVPKNVQVRVPLQAWWQRTVGGGQLHPRLLVVAEEGSDVTVVAGEVSKLQEQAFGVFVAEIFAKPNAQVRLAFLQEHDPQMTRAAHVRAKVERDARVQIFAHDRGSGTGLVDVIVEQTGDGSEVWLDGLVTGTGKQHLDLTLKAEHIGRHTLSRIRTRALLTDHAKATCRAVSQIEKGAVGTDSSQEERVLLLSKTAQANPIPMLLINEEDVRCDHSASVGPLSEEQLYYLKSRGVTDFEARKLLLKSFLAPLVQTSPLPVGMEVLTDKWLDRKGVLR
ncbi:SufD family Fe-S cluster assembly protein [Tumebacillus sp. ITR2]|uniref:SufD family Fe-S cluster assembly protein n=1 Tax=Tumebacillus amylolyticus TaxID=2801339 RepID=A0ABS1J8Z5_9BACL|nr:SufD family Fe-S cluster assembly protein [Tumebacillus amylolyticus]MBL0386747.1 SufD family Fe-S cluster assembly protein [Tumebacillus amylolyticus]